MRLFDIFIPVLHLYRFFVIDLVVIVEKLFHANIIFSFFIAYFGLANLIVADRDSKAIYHVDNFDGFI